MWAWTIMVSLKILIVQNKTEYHLVGNSLVLKQLSFLFEKEKKKKNRINDKYEVKCRILHA